MFDIGWSELLIVGAIALIVIGPRDLPRTLRAIGQMTAKIRRMAGEFQGQFNEAMREAELDEIRRNVESVKDVTSAFDKPFNPIETARNEIKNAIEGAGTVAKEDPAAKEGAGTAPAPVDLPPPDLPAAPDPAKAIAAAPGAEPAPKPRRGTKAAASAAPKTSEPKTEAKTTDSKSAPKPRAGKAAAAKPQAAGGEGATAKPAASKARSTTTKKAVASPADGGEA
ncbi:sec-independent protein translocase protein TatB [Chelatococcus caeni]|uniref:Sec-independent protein translocase protein TatB n=1 Tax=Chelatococcus caeni TaxID=1348468 RepID=A0A840BXU4_9HYPH|nr:Sec-independent protein translocase protein TatB [Chelatococcus caeni]MBB4016532.1 sec-independent protein translocase protein TatB [Chelatococcus caeni]